MTSRPRSGSPRPLAPSLALTAGLVSASLDFVLLAGWWVLPEAPAKRALLALAVSVGSWEAASSWTWRRLWPGAARHGL